MILASTSYSSRLLAPTHPQLYRAIRADIELRLWNNVLPREQFERHLLGQHRQDDLPLHQCEMIPATLPCPRADFPFGNRFSSLSGIAFLPFRESLFCPPFITLSR